MGLRTAAAGAAHTRAARRRALRTGLGLLVLLLFPCTAVRAGWSVPASLESSQPGNPSARPARGRFLVANRSLRDPSFVETVVLLVDYDANGALGVVINRPTEIPLTTALPEVEELRKRKDLVFLGGPVSRDRMVILLRANAEPPQSVQVFEKVFATGSVSVLRRSISHGDAVRAYAGYAGWGPGQLDAEVARGDWLIGPADSKAIFDDPPDDMWSRLVERFSGDWTQVAPELMHVAAFQPHP